MPDHGLFCVEDCQKSQEEAQPQGTPCDEGNPGMRTFHVHQPLCCLPAGRARLSSTITLAVVLVGVQC
jgi:hypothetical protein